MKLLFFKKGQTAVFSCLIFYSKFLNWRSAFLNRVVKNPTLFIFLLIINVVSRGTTYDSLIKVSKSKR